MTDDFDPNWFELTLHEDAAFAHLGYLSAKPGDRTDGEWVVLFEREERAPIELAHFGLALDFEDPPLLPPSKPHRGGVLARSLRRC